MAEMKITPDESLATIAAVQIRIDSLVNQGLGDSPRCNALRCRLGENDTLLPLPPKAGPVAKLMEDGTVILPNGMKKNISALASDLTAFTALCQEGKVELKATVYANYKGGIGEQTYQRLIPNGAKISAFMNETPQTSTAQLRGAFTGEVIIKGSLNDNAAAEIEPFLTARASQKRQEGSRLKVYNNPLFLVAASLMAA